MMRQHINKQLRNTKLGLTFISRAIKFVIIFKIVLRH